ncbi:MAG TPA: UDP-N-acetylglucosamine 1-carboxyvinyltransferase [Chthonomonadales bacterium]|nr:UDP-N-acetylglucosamine 1-carboxyvinyltransferase [Chthonomonadales bacterium]
MRIVGGKPLCGSVATGGSKNATLAIMAGAMLADGTVTLHNIPRIGDIETMVDLLNGLGAATTFVGPETIRIDARNVHCLEAPYELVRMMRASFSVLGPLLARFGFARVPVPGGCDIGARPVNFHIDGLRQLGADIQVEHGVYTASTHRLIGASIYLDFQSAGATQHLMTAACLADGVTIIENCATEPEVVDTAEFLRVLGAEVTGAGSTTITVRGVERLSGGEYSIIPDRMEAGTYAVAAAITGGDVFIRHATADHLRPFTRKLREAGVEVREATDGVRVSAEGRPRAVNIKTMPHPGFPTDMQQPFAAMLSIADGTSVITETVYESRFRYANELNRMGSDVRVEGRTAVIRGVSRLTGAPVTATDLRAGAALICAGMAAEGDTEVSGVEHIDRGYADLVPKLRSLGAVIERCEVEQLARR